MGTLGLQIIAPSPYSENCMYPRRTPGKIFPKISTLPRQRSEASHHLDLYKLTVEKNRLQTELQSLNQRSQCIQQRLSEINTQTGDLEYEAQRLRDAADEMQPSMPTSHVYLPSHRSGEGRNLYTSQGQAQHSGDFDMLLLEY